MSNSPLILGLDPGYDRLGWGMAQQINSSWQKVVYGCIETDRHQSLLARYQQLETDLSDLIIQYHPEEAALETLFFNHNQTTAMAVSEARGIILATLLHHHLPIAQYSPSQIKLTTTGYGRADKLAMEKMVRLEFKLPTDKIRDDALDALAVVLTHQVHRQQLPKSS